MSAIRNIIITGSSLGLACAGACGYETGNKNPDVVYATKDTTITTSGVLGASTKYIDCTYLGEWVIEPVPSGGDAYDLIAPIAKSAIENTGVRLSETQLAECTDQIIDQSTTRLPVTSEQKEFVALPTGLDPIRVIIPSS